jgi:hypothetical protein
MIEGLGFLEKPGDRPRHHERFDGTLPARAGRSEILSRPGSSPWPTPWTRSLQTVPTAGAGASKMPSGDRTGEREPVRPRRRARIPVHPGGRLAAGQGGRQDDGAVAVDQLRNPPNPPFTKGGIMPPNPPCKGKFLMVPL